MYFIFCTEANHAWQMLKIQFEGNLDSLPYGVIYLHILVIKITLTNNGNDCFLGSEGRNLYCT